MLSTVLLGGFILLAYSIEAITGFGSLVIALSLGALVLPIESLLPILVPLNVLMSIYFTLRHPQHIDKQLYFKTILPIMTVGVLVGIFSKPWLHGAWLHIGFAVIIVAFSSRELWKSYHRQPVKPHPTIFTQVMILVGGVVHGLFASGGPLVVYGLSGVKLNKAQFRATLILVWLTVNSMLTLQFLITGALRENANTILMYIPLIVLGIVIGEKLHHRVDEDKFRVIIFILLLLTGLVLLAKQLF